MSDSILRALEALSADSRPLTSCPDARVLVMAARRTLGDHAMMTALPQHLVECAVCARRWEVLQNQQHVERGTLVALRQLDASSFARLAAMEHLRHCEQCRQLDRWVQSLAVVPDSGSVRVSNVLLMIRTQPEALAFRETRGDDERSIEAQVIRSDGTPVLHHDVAQQIAVTLQSAEIDRTGRLTVVLAVPEPYTAVVLAIGTEIEAVKLPAVPVVNGTARLDVETQTVGEARRLSKSNLTVWVVE